MGKRSRQLILLLGVLAMVALIFTACAGQQAAAPTAQEPTKQEASKEAKATYVGTETCAKCHQGHGADFKKTNHIQAFKPLSDYQLDKPIGEITIFDTANTEKAVSTKLDFSTGKVYGVMMDHYIVAEIPKEAGFKGTTDGKMYYRVGALHKEEDKWAFEPASKGDYDKDGKQDLGAATYTCASCHSPGLASGSKEYGISCESCHGPGSLHVTAEKKAGTMSLSQDACLSCHQDGKPVKDGNGNWTAQNHYGTRGYYLTAHAKSTKLNDCLACHTSHKPNGEGKLIAAENAQALCMTCHSDKKYDPEKLMWKNKTDLRDHFVKDHSFGVMPYEDYGDDPKTKPIEITNPKWLEVLNKKNS